MLFFTISQIRSMIPVVVKSEKGQGLVEYALILVLVSIAVIVLLGLLGGQLNNVFNGITAELAPTS